MRDNEKVITDALEQSAQSINDARTTTIPANRYIYAQLARQFNYIALMMRYSGTPHWGKWHAAWLRSNQKLDVLSNR